MIIGTTAEYQYHAHLCLPNRGMLHCYQSPVIWKSAIKPTVRKQNGFLPNWQNRGYAVPDTSEPESKGLTVQMPADFFTEHTLGNLRQICENKASLFQAAFQTDSLDIIPSDEKVEFPWFTVEQDGDADAYCTFISMLCEFAKNQSRINRKPDTSDNPKYTMRCFLIRLGMVGAEFKAARKVILRQSVTGNSAFRKVGDTDAVSE